MIIRINIKIITMNEANTLLLNLYTLLSVKRSLKISVRKIEDKIRYSSSIASSDKARMIVLPSIIERLPDKSIIYNSLFVVLQITEICSV